ncbi:hypothetical protein PsorP6_006803 [Peronosclerospora sorghi]|uniref:Uncharacterized protein n=1 Tax=Peronosclerospora sorghi TaxID=230839 RepID=A0ACC0W9G5_9STRA|nr:hypothetical protein PsorP6_006803 [Peronosclerospora sorghi]
MANIALAEPHKQADGAFDHVLECLETTTKLDPTNHRAWHEGALMNFRALETKFRSRNRVWEIPSSFFRSISFGHTSYDVNKDVLRLLTLWFAQGNRSDVHMAIVEGFQECVDTAPSLYMKLIWCRESLSVAIVWNELWHGALVEVSKHFFNNRDVAAMIAELATLHEQMDQIGTEETPNLREVAFYQAFARDLMYAKEWTNVYELTKSLYDLNPPWDIY